MTQEWHPDPEPIKPTTPRPSPRHGLWAVALVALLIFRPAAGEQPGGSGPASPGRVRPAGHLERAQPAAPELTFVTSGPWPLSPRTPSRKSPERAVTPHYMGICPAIMLDAMKKTLFTFVVGVTALVGCGTSGEPAAQPTSTPTAQSAGTVAWSTCTGLTGPPTARPGRAPTPGRPVRQGRRPPGPRQARRRHDRPRVDPCQGHRRAVGSLVFNFGGPGGIRRDTLPARRGLRATCAPATTWSASTRAASAAARA